MANEKIHIYQYQRECWKCKTEIPIYTYLLEDYGNNKNIKYPYEKDYIIKMMSEEYIITYGRFSM